MAKTCIYRTLSCTIIILRAFFVFPLDVSELTLLYPLPIPAGHNEVDKPVQLTRVADCASKQ